MIATLATGVPRGSNAIDIQRFSLAVIHEPSNQPVNTDALRRPPAAPAPLARRRLHARYMAWGRLVRA